MAKINDYFRKAKMLALCVAVPLIINSCSCGKKNVVGPDNGTLKAPVLESVDYGRTPTNQTDLTGRILYKNQADSAIVKINGKEQRIPIQSGSTINVILEKEGENILETKIKGEGGESNPEKDTIITDWTASTVDSMGVPRYSNSRNTKVTPSVPGADSMKIFEKGSTADFKAYNTLDTVVLSTSEGQKWIYGIFKDIAGNITKDSAITILDITAPIIPNAFKDTTIEDNMVNLGNVPTTGLKDKRIVCSGATDKITTPDSLNYIIYNEGTNYVALFLEDSAGNISKDTAVIIANKIDSAAVMAEVLNYYKGKGFSPSDSGKLFTATNILIDSSVTPPDTSYLSYGQKFDHTFKLNDTLFHHIKVTENPLSQNIRDAFDNTTELNGLYGMPDRLFLFSREFRNVTKAKLEDKYKTHGPQ